MKYLLLLLLASPSFALMPAKEARDNAYKIHAQAVEKQLPKLLVETEKGIEEACTEGLYSTTVPIDSYDSVVVNKAMNILSEEGYYVSVDHLILTRENVLTIEWK
jgi:hypothetical protein